MKKIFTIPIVIGLLFLQVSLTVFIAQPPENTEAVLAERERYLGGNYINNSPEAIRTRERTWDLIARDNSLIGRGLEIFFLNVLFGLIPAIIAKRKGLCSKNKGRCTFMVWWVYGTWLFVVALPHSVISKADVQAVEKNKQDFERKQQKLKQDRERRQQKLKQSINKIGQRVEQHNKQTAEREEQRRKLMHKTDGKTVPVVAIGGNGWEFLTNKKLIIGLCAEGLCLWDMKGLKSYTISGKTITDITVGGPGTVRTGGGAMGGGFGVDGFLVGAAAATVLNILTFHKTTKTLVHVKCKDSEIFLLISTMEPDETRIYLSPLFVSLKSKTNTSKDSSGTSGIAAEIEKLAKLLAEGHITSEEFANLKSRLF